MKILLVSATEFEILPFLDKTEWPELSVLVTGVGQMQTAFHLGAALQREKFDLVINAGICGSFRKDWNLGEVVNVVSEEFGDLGVEEADGSFSDIFELGFWKKNSFPFEDKKLLNKDALDFKFLKIARGLSVNKVHGFPPSIERIVEKYNADVESMEGAGFFYACLLNKVKFLEIRSISNFVEKRNRAAWNIELALDNLHAVLRDIIGAVHEPNETAPSQDPPKNRGHL